MLCNSSDSSEPPDSIITFLLKYQRKLTLFECLQRQRYWADCFKYVISFNSLITLEDTIKLIFE